MKKVILIITLICSAALLLTSCVKSCTCINPDTGKSREFDIEPSESCNSYSNLEWGTCS